ILSLLMAVEQIVSLPADALQRLEHADLDVPQRPREHPVGAGVLQLLCEGREVGGVARNHDDRDRLEAHLFRELLRELELDARERDVLSREADLHLLAGGLLLDEAEREATVPLGSERRGAENQRARRRKRLARADAAAEQQRKLLGLGLGHE